ncbi:chemotaxis protein CheA [Alicycliphilus denitrificans]|uniref:chemotaxis protein CheA n=1 Tax=Alicycliphilus denitrificans TaxID=179636 RepID=UPI003850F6CF
MEEIFAVFIQEAREQLTAMEDGLLRMEQGDTEADLLNAIFRAAHTIKGASGVVELHHIERFTHVLENLLDRLRNGELAVSSEMITLLLQGCDHIGSLLGIVEQGNTEEDPVLARAGQGLADGLRAFGSQGGTAAHGSADPGVVQPGPAAGEGNDDGAGAAAAADGWHISIRFGPNVLKLGMDPLNFLRYLQQLGEVTHLTTLSDAMPAAQEMDAEACYLGFEITLHSRAGKEEIENVFAFCRDDCELRILPPHSRVADYLQLIAQLPEEPLRLGEILVRSGALTREELDAGLHQQRDAQDKVVHTPGATAAPPSPPIGEILVERKVVQPEIVEAAAARQKQVQDKRSADARLIRVQADKLDQLIDLVGELVIAGASASLLARRSGQGPLMEATSVLSRLVENIRDSALQLRMVQIGETFNRFNRVVRDTAREIGKDIELVISGAETELDKSVVEKIGDPLMHLVRNAMDHGIELPQVRTALGKPARGRLELNAFHDSGSIVIEVSDDGGGINAERVQAKAIERGLIQAGHSLTEQEIVNLVFEAGFSTAESVSNLSGRGVGMDVVKRNIQALRGSVEVKTWAGQGSRFTIRLPLTLAIIDGFLTAVGPASYVIPLDAVVECLELQAQDTRGAMLNLRGEVLPFIRLRDFFEIKGQPPARENVVVIAAGNYKAGIVVDQLLGEFQTVIKPLGQLFRHLRGIGGSTILGSGEVALILDVQALTHLAAQREESRQVPPAASHGTTTPVQPSFATP